ncbi:MAG TPA: NADPH-dependent F420 reductase [Chloroflexi bacterium]|nr:NADPH-dependent F420 reductase [Chloroflexota bacterium]
MKIAILGGTGPEGTGLGLRWAATGHEVIIGSRLTEKGERVAAELKSEYPDGNITGTDNLTAAQEADLVVLTVPYEAQKPTLAHVKDALSGKLLITVVAPTRKPKARVWRLPSGLSAAEEAQQLVGDDTSVVAAMQNIGAHNLRDLDYQLECDVLVCGDNQYDKELAIKLCADAGFRGINAGALQNASVVEGLTSILIGINIRNKVKDAGIRITGI